MLALARLLSLAVAVLFLASLPAFAQTADADQSKALLKQGLDQYSKQDYKAAKATLIKANDAKASLDAAQVKELDGALEKVDLAIRKQSAAQEQITSAESAVKANDLDKAESLYTEAIANEFLPAAQKKDATAQLALVKQRKLAAANTTSKPAAAVVATATNGAASKPAVVVATPAVATGTAASKPAAGATSAPVAAPMLAELEANRVKAAQLIKEGKVALDRGDADAAQKKFQQAQALIGLTDEVKALEEQAAQMASTAGGTTPLTRLEQMMRLRQQQAQIEFDRSMKRSMELLAGADSSSTFDASTEAARRANEILEGAKSVMSADEYREKKLAVDEQLSYVSSQRRKWEGAQAGRILAEQERLERERRTKEVQQRAEKIATLTINAKNFMAQRKYHEAVEIIDQIICLDPCNQWALARREMLEQEDLLAQEKDAFKTRNIEEQKQAVALREAEIPWWEIVRYPKDWKALTLRREPYGANAATESESDRLVNQRLRQKLQKLEFDGIEFQQVIQFFRDVTGTSIYVKWSALQAVGIDKTAPVNVRLADVTFYKGLRTVLDDVGGQNPLSFVVDEGVITISTKDDLSKRTITRVYDIRDLIFRVPNFVGPRIEMQTVSQAGGQNGGNGGGTSIFGNNSSNGSNNPEGNTPTRAEMIAGITEMIKATIEPNTWRPTGEIGDVREIHGELVVTQTAENHQALVSLITQLREARALQIAIEARFISVNSGFLNSIGLKLDFFFNIGSSLGSNTVTDPWTGATVPTKTGTSGWGPEKAHNNVLTPIPVIQNSNTFTNMLGTSTSVPNSIGGLITTPAISTFFTYLDDIQVDFLLQATQANQTTRTLTAPRITLFNGQRSYITVATQQAYVANLTPIVSDNSTAFAPTIGVVPTGSVLDVEATVSADRRYVTLTVRPQVSVLNGFTKYFTSVASVDANGNPLTGVGYIQLPNVTVQDLNTTVNVPDKGTLLLGGQRLTGEVEREEGAPLLDKLPILNRLFTNRGKVRDEQTLLILIKPTILIQREQEELQCP